MPNRLPHFVSWVLQNKKALKQPRPDRHYIGSRRLFRTDCDLLSVIVRRHRPGLPIDVADAEDAYPASRPGVRGGIPGHKI